MLVRAAAAAAHGLVAEDAEIGEELGPLPGHIRQEDAMAFAPPGARVWKGHNRDEWTGWLHPHIRVRCVFLSLVASRVL